MNEILKLIGILLAVYAAIGGLLFIFVSILRIRPLEFIPQQLNAVPVLADPSLCSVEPESTLKKLQSAGEARESNIAVKEPIRTVVSDSRGGVQFFIGNCLK